jgi:hypothetical protein
VVKRLHPLIALFHHEFRKQPVLAAARNPCFGLPWKLFVPSLHCSVIIHQSAKFSSFVQSLSNPYQLDNCQAHGKLKIILIDVMEQENKHNTSCTAMRFKKDA